MLAFDHILDRKDGNSLKWGRYRGTDIIPAWVADMDIPSPPCVIEALQQRLHDHPLMGYERPGDGVYGAIQDYLNDFHGWQVARESIIFLPGLVPAINWCCRMAGNEQGDILVPSPIYPPFLTAPANQGQRCVRLPHRLCDGLWQIDWDGWEQAVTPRSKALLFCHPHNPLGRWWRDEELRQVIEFCQRHDLLLISDEIHCQLLLDQRQQSPAFRSTATINEWAKENTVTLLAPSKTYNIPGMACAYAVIEDTALRQRFMRASAGCIPEITPLSFVACEAAYRHGEPWRQEMLTFLRRNRDLMQQAVASWDGVEGCHLEATYLAWLDVSALGLEDPHATFEAAGVGLGDGRAFGNHHFVRVNLGTPLPILQEIIRRMDQVIRNRV